jgi:hypothetical protein
MKSFTLICLFVLSLSCKKNASKELGWLDFLKKSRSETTHFVPSEDSFFLEKKPLALSVESDLEPLMYALLSDPTKWRSNQKLDFVPPSDFPIQFKLDLGQGTKVINAKATRVFGRFGKTCLYPKLKLVFEESESKAHVFGKIQSIYLMLPCQTRLTYDEKNNGFPSFSEENQQQQVSHLLHKAILRADLSGLESRRTQVTLHHRVVRGSGTQVTSTLDGYFLEDAENVARRNKAELFTEGSFGPETNVECEVQKYIQAEIFALIFRSRPDHHAYCFPNSVDKAKSNRAAQLPFYLRDLHNYFAVGNPKGKTEVFLQFDLESSEARSWLLPSALSHAAVQTWLSQKEQILWDEFGLDKGDGTEADLCAAIRQVSARLFGFKSLAREQTTLSEIFYENFNNTIDWHTELLSQMIHKRCSHGS